MELEKLNYKPNVNHEKHIYVNILLKFEHKYKFWLVFYNYMHLQKSDFPN